MPSPQITKIPLMEKPEAWLLPRGIEVRAGIPQGGSVPVVAFRNIRTREAVAALATVLKQDEELPAWMLERISKIA